MIDISVRSGWFILALVLGPAVMKLAPRLRGGAFLVISVSLYMACLDRWLDLAAIALFTCLPYLYLSPMRKYSLPLWPSMIILVSLFIYLSGYTWLVEPIVGKERLYGARLLGLSYILFRQCDVLLHFKAEFIKRVSFADYICYSFSFWTILAGPIQRFKQFREDFYSEKPLPENGETLECLHRAANGLLKVFIFAQFFRDVSDLSYSNLLEHGPLYHFSLPCIFYCFPLYVYFNFSGYCDLVIAAAKWAGFSIPENFNRPYMARDMIDFWNRWHITLSQWIRDFVYQPLLKHLLSTVLKKQIALAQYLSIFITFFLVGIWHGATINFVIFGILHGLGMALSMIYRNNMRKYLGRERYNTFRDNRIVAAVEIAVCMHYVCFAALFFEYDVGHILNGLGRMIGKG